MPRRLPGLGRRLDRARPIRFRWNDKPLSGFAGDTLASALLAEGRLMQGRSFKYHRPRGPVAAGAEEPNALIGVGARSRMTPNLRATTTPLTPGLVAQSQNHWPSLAVDIGELNAFAAPVFPAGFYYKTFIAPRAAWKHLFEPVIRQAAGLGRAPTQPDPDAYEHFHLETDVLVAGGGTSGLAAARAAAQAGVRGLLVEQSPAWGGRAATDGVTIDGQDAQTWVDAQIAALSALPNFSALPNRADGKPSPHHQTTIHLNCEDSQLLHQVWCQSSLKHQLYQFVHHEEVEDAEAELVPLHPLRPLPGARPRPLRTEGRTEGVIETRHGGFAVEEEKFIDKI